jgi:hypothetical protein
MARLRPGWLVVLCAVVVLVSAWLPWLTTGADGGGRANAIGGKNGHIGYPPDGFGVGQLIVLLASTLIVAAAMSARSLSPRITSTAALGISVLLAVMALWYYRLYVISPIAAGYGFYVAVAATLAAAALSVLAMVVAWAERIRSR